jgi:hypothetical protein
VHDIVRIGQTKKKIEYFMDERIFVLDGVPDEYELGDAHLMQVHSHKSQKPFIDTDEIERIRGSYGRALSSVGVWTWTRGEKRRSVLLSCV